MKNLRKMVFGIILFTLTLSPTIRAASPSLATREMVLQLLKEYAPDGYYIVDTFEKARDQVQASELMRYTNDGFMTFVKGETELDIVKSLGVVVHETCHDYCHTVAYALCKERFRKISWGSQYDAYYGGDETTFLVKRTKVFNTREIAASIPEELRTFRFMPYVTLDTHYNIPGMTIDLSQLDPDLLADFKNLGSQVNGVYGLMNEYTAYYHETRTKLDLYKYYRDKLEPNINNWVAFLSGVDGCHFAHLEFKFFILKYLQYAKSHYPKLYKEFKKNRELVQAFLTIDRNYTQTVADYYQRKEEIFENFRQEGYAVTVDDDNFYIKGASVNKQVSHFLKTYNLLKNELAKEEYQTLLGELQWEVDK
jgi:hypothetical protein